MSLKLNTASGGSITLQEADTASNLTLTVPAVTGTMNTSGSVNEVPAGSAASPSITTTGDTNTGIFFPTADTIAFAEGGTEVMRINSSGSVGIGTTTPTNYGGTTLSINSPGESFLDMWHAGTRQGILVGASGKIVLVGISTNSIAFETNNAERMRIDSSGNVLVGTTANEGVNGISFNPTIAPGIIINKSFSGTANGVRFWHNSSQVGSITYSNTATAYNTSSDYRLKENIVPMTGALDTVQALKPVTYKWKVDGSYGQGFIAHELQAVVPDCVTGEKDAVNEDGSIRPQGVDTSFLVATLTAAIQELKAVVDAQAERIATLENK
jgi:hypothetical protein